MPREEPPAAVGKWLLQPSPPAAVGGSGTRVRGRAPEERDPSAGIGVHQVYFQFVTPWWWESGFRRRLRARLCGAGGGASLSALSVSLARSSLRGGASLCADCGADPRRAPGKPWVRAKNRVARAAAAPGGAGGQQRRPRAYPLPGTGSSALEARPRPRPRRGRERRGAAAGPRAGGGQVEWGALPGHGA